MFNHICLLLVTLLQVVVAKAATCADIETYQVIICELFWLLIGD